MTNLNLDKWITKQKERKAHVSDKVALEYPQYQEDWKTEDSTGKVVITKKELDKIQHDLSAVLIPSQPQIDEYHKSLIQKRDKAGRIGKFKVDLINKLDFFSPPTFVVYTGRPGAGKSSKFADKMVAVMLRNKAWYERLYMYPIDGFIPIKRKVYTNSPIKKEVIEKLGLKDYYGEFRGIHQALNLRDCDIFWDEMQVDCHIDQDQKLPRQAFEFFQQHRKLGLEIYATSQDFAQLTKGVRRTVMHLVYYVKIIGSRNPSATRPPVKKPFLLSLGFTLDPALYEEDSSKKGLGFDLSTFPEIMYLNAEKLLRYSTGYIITQGDLPPFQHYERRCGNPSCTHCKVYHI